MESNGNRCPYCGSENKVMPIVVISGVTGDYEYYAQCYQCHAEGPITDTSEAATHAFCHPAHLMKNKVLVKRETAQECLYRLEAVGLNYGGSPDGLAAFADLTAALEGKK